MSDATPEPELINLTDEEEVKIECSVLVYLEWDRKTRSWVIAPCTVDGHPLDTTEAGISSDCGPYSQLQPADQDAWDDALAAPVPDAVTLAYSLLAAAGESL